uniref:cell wall protein DAN4-like n=1 Tax=Ciona intestinalis TaxID=7719 RepID=UPI000EF4ACCA|nr:cell wall protein DAN4-like [Ciona intestinalis]|eukprot:XP_026691453.1 cell wall protein DAN4-like [Ciona intestinalis]
MTTTTKETTPTPTTTKEITPTTTTTIKATVPTKTETTTKESKSTSTKTKAITTTTPATEETRSTTTATIATTPTTTINQTTSSSTTSVPVTKRASIKNEDSITKIASYPEISQVFLPNDETSTSEKEISKSMAAIQINASDRLIQETLAVESLDLATGTKEMLLEARLTEPPSIETTSTSMEVEPTTADTSCGDLLKELAAWKASFSNWQIYMERWTETFNAFEKQSKGNGGL